MNPTPVTERPVTPIAMAIAGSDSGGGAGIQADIKTFSALGVFGCSAISSLTAQNTLGVQGVLPIPPDFVQAQIQSVLSDLPVAAIKTGMLATADIIVAVVDALANFPRIPLVVDPVMIATSGDRLLAEDASRALITRLIPRSTLVTPNLFEAAALLNDQPAQSQAEMLIQARRILELGCSAVLIKGGHREGSDATDLLVTADGESTFTRARVTTRNTHGTGCTLASAITAGLAKGLSLHDSIAQAKEYLQQAILHADDLYIGQGSGPVHHFFKFY